MPGSSKNQIEPTRKRLQQSRRATKSLQISLSESLKSNIDLWKDNIGSFWNFNAEKASLSQLCPISTIYKALSELEIRNAGDRIRLRFMKVLFHHLKDRSCATSLEKGTVEWMACRIIAAGYKSGDKDRISSKIRNWAYLGSKYDALCRDIGVQNDSNDYSYLGHLFRLPEDVTDRL